MEKYLLDISHTELIDIDDEVELARRIREGDEEAMRKLVCANLRFVVSVAKQYQNQGMDLNDIINEGNIGMIKAARKFDETRGFKFISYAVWWIRQSILQAIAEQSRTVRLPMNLVGLLNKIKQAGAEFEQKHQRLPSIDELAEMLEIDPEKLANIFEMKGGQLSLDTPLSDDESSTLLEILPAADGSGADTSLSRESLAIEIDRALQKLPLREREVVKMSFGIGCDELTLEEIAEQFDLTRERVRQIREKGLRHLRKSHSELLRQFLG